MKKAILHFFLWFFLSCVSLELIGQNSITNDTRITQTAFLYERIDFEIQLSSSYINPFDANEIALDMILVAPSGKTLHLPCYFVSGVESASIWNARFAPQESGTYTYHFQLDKNNISVYTSADKQFIVYSTAKNGFIHSNNNWSFIYDSGKPFRGIGEDLGWEARNYEDQHYRYDYFLPKLAQCGVNYFRTWMCNWNLPVECKTVMSTNFYTNSPEYFNPGGIKRMDQLVNLCDSLDMHMMLTLVPHGSIITTGEWNINNYNVMNGGPATTPNDFFTLPAAKAKFKNKLRYLVARWGYSPSIGAWELCNEIDNAAMVGLTYIIPAADIVQWHTEMSNYLKSIDLYGHLITTSVSWRDITGLNNVAGIDFNQQHIYKNTSSIPSVITKYENDWTKPYVIGEFGFDWDWNNVTTAAGPSFDYDLKRGLWYGLFTSTPIVPMSWWWEFFDARGMTSYYKSVTDISSQMLLGGEGSFFPGTVSAGTLGKYVVKCGQKYFIYLLNNGAGAVTSPVLLSVSDNVDYSVQTLLPLTHTYTTLNNITAVSGSLNLGSITLAEKSEIVYVVKLAGDESGILTSFGANAISIPGRLELENFDKGGEGIAYHDFDTSNFPFKYRTKESVDCDTAGDGGYCISSIIKGEWLKYSVNITISGTYSVEVRVAAVDTGKYFHILLDDDDISGLIKVPNTGGLHNWQTVLVNLKIPNLMAGQRILKIEMDASEFAIDNVLFNLTNKLPAVSLSSPAKNGSFNFPVQLDITADATDEDESIAKVTFFNGPTKLGEIITSPFTMVWNGSVGNFKLFAVATDDKGLSAVSDTVSGSITSIPDIPDTIQAEDYGTGGEGMSYHELSAGNKFGFYRTDNVDLESCTDVGGGFSLGDFQTGEWVQYTVNATKSGNYKVDLRVASQMDATAIRLSVDGQNVTGNISVPNTTGWQTFQTISIEGIQLDQGMRTIRLLSVTQYVNINYLVFGLTTGIDDVLQNELRCYPNPVFSILQFENMPVQITQIQVLNSVGQVVLTRYAMDNRVDMSSLASGFYTVVLLDSKYISVKRFKVVKNR